jgi:hypothetical protein
MTSEGSSGRTTVFPAQRAGSQGTDALGQICGNLGETGTLGRGESEKRNPIFLQADLLDQCFRESHPLLGAQITLQVMAGALQSAGHEHSIGTALEGTQDVQNVDPPRTGQFDDLDVCRVRKPHRPGQVRSRVGAVVATETNDLRLEGVFRHLFLQLGDRPRDSPYRVYAITFGQRFVARDSGARGQQMPRCAR